MISSVTRLGSAAALSLLVSACETPRDTRPVALGQPLAELDDAQLARFRAGEALFNHVFTPQEGLGPLFNDNQCSACHTKPETGGTGDQFLTRATRTLPAGQCDQLEEAGGENVRVQATPLLKAHGIDRQPLPSNATERARFSVPFLFGAGLVDAIPEEQILDRADPDDRDRNGISGRPGRDVHGRFARFGRKADQATLRDFIESAAHFEMGLTTPLRPHEGNLGGQPFPEGVDPAPEPELDERGIQRLVDFVAFLAPPSRRMGETSADLEAITRGEELFHTTGCTNCHVPSMHTGRNEVDALDNRRVFLYSDLLLHDMGPDLANACSVGASATELRTEPLMGLARRQLFLHDSRTNDLTEAILFHGGEAAAVRERFRALSEVQQIYLLRFLNSL